MNSRTPVPGNQIRQFGKIPTFLALCRFVGLSLCRVLFFEYLVRSVDIWFSVGAILSSRISRFKQMRMIGAWAGRGQGEVIGCAEERQYAMVCLLSVDSNR